MNDKDFFDIENQIEDAIDNAFKYINYANRKATNVRNNLFKNITNMTEDAFIGAKTKFEDNADGIDKKFKKVSKKFKDDIKKSNREEDKEFFNYIAKNPSGKYKGLMYNVIGVIGSIGFAIGFGVFSMLTMFNNTFIRFGVNMTLGTIFIFFIASLFLAVKGYKIRKRLWRFNRYSSILKDKNFSEISKLAEVVSKKNKFVIKDLENMMNFDMFKEGHISEDKSYFILGDKVYEEYLNSIKSYNERKNEEKENAEDSTNTEKNELSSVIELGEKYVSEIESINYSLRGNNICTKLDQMLTIIRNIFDNIKNNPDNLPLVKKFLNHYLPTTLKLVKAYKDLNDQSIEGENIRKAKEEIEKSIDLINTAFKNLLDDLFEDIVLDVSSDISVLETLFSQEGLTEDDFKKKNK